MKKIHCEEVMKKGFDKLPIENVREMVGFYEPEKRGRQIVWEVSMLGEGEGYTAKSQFEAEVIANQQMILGLLLKKVR